MAGARRTAPECASAAPVTMLSARPCASLASVLAVHGATTSRSARRRWGYGSSAAGRRARAANVFARTNRSAPGVTTGTTSWPRLTSRRTSSHALYAAMPPLTPTSTRAIRLFCRSAAGVRRDVPELLLGVGVVELPLCDLLEGHRQVVLRARLDQR